jgi:hypothetical protein
MDYLKKGHDWIKKNKAVSKTANALGFSTVGNIASILGYGN